MFFKRPFFIVLLISLVWHLFWMAAISIVILPDNSPLNNYRPVNFLGPLLKGAAKPLGRMDETETSFSLNKTIGDVTCSLHSAAEQTVTSLPKKIIEPHFRIPGNKFSPEMLTLVKLSENKQAVGDKNLPQDKMIKYSISEDGRAYSLSRALTSPQPEEDILNMRRLWQERLYKNR